MSVYDQSAPAQGHQALNDIDLIRSNTNALRSNESSLAASPPANPVAGQFWFESDTGTSRQRTNAGTWVYRWSETDTPAKTSDLTAHTGTNITNAVTVHGIKQGTGNAFDADLLDGQHGSYYLAATHAATASGVHGIAGSVVGTTDIQTLTNKTLTTPTITTPTIADLTNMQHDHGTAAKGGSTLAVGIVNTAQLVDGSVTQVKIAAAAVGQGQLKSATGAVMGTTGNLTLPGGEYGFYPQIKGDNTNTCDIRFLNGVFGFTYVTNISFLGTGNYYAQQRYIQASPPYMIGNKIWGHFLFLLRDIATGTVRSAYEAEDPPWAYNGAIYLPKDDPGRLNEIPHPFADYWQKDPAIDGLEIVMVDLSGRDVKKAKIDLRKTGKGLIEDIPMLVPGKGTLKAHADYMLPVIPKFSSRVKIITP